MRIRFISSTPMNVFRGSGTYVGIETLARALRALGVEVDIVTPRLRFPIYTVQRLVFNQALRFRRRSDYDVTVGFDMDGYTIAGQTRTRYETHFVVGSVGDTRRNSAPEGRPNLAQRFSAGESGKDQSSPGGTAQFRNRLTSAGYTSVGAGSKVHVAAIKGVVADEMRFESGLTKMTMRLQAACEAKHVQRADFVMTTSAYAAGQIQQLYGVSQPPRIVPEPIDLAAWEDLAKSNAPPPADKFIVLAVCRFYPRKRLPVLLAAADRLRSRIRGLEVRIVGGGPEEDRLRAICRERNLERLVVWRRNISGADLAREYSQCHLFCLPSVQEGFGIVFLEAMANGKPVVAARAGATPEVVQHGLLVEPDNDQELSSAIERLYREPLLCESLGNAGRAFVRRFDAPVVGRMFLRELEGFVTLKAEAFGREAESGSGATQTGRS